MEKRIPRMRFKEFIGSGEWEEKKLGEISEIFIDGDWIETKDQSNSGIRLIQTGNIGINRFLDNRSKAKWVSLNTFYKLNCKEVYPGDILISRLPEPAGRACIVPRMDNRMITSVDCTIVRLHEEYRNEYIIQYFEKDKYFKDILIFLAGGTRQRISRNNLSNIIVPIPSLSEQERIGDFFQKLDRLIDINREKLGKLKASKSAYLAEMFPREGEDRPRRRFQGFTGAWEKKKLGEILRTDSFRSYIKKPQFNGEHIVIQQGNDPVAGYADGDPYLDYEKVVLFGDHTLSLYKPKVPFFISTDGLKIIYGSNNMDSNFILYTLELYKPKNEGYKRYYSILKDKEVYISKNLAEQEKIGNFFKKLDQQIEVQEEKLEKLEKMKKAYLAEMFV